MGFRQEPPEAAAWHHLAVVFDGVVERVYVDGELNNAAAKMLLMHEGRPIYVGASVPGTEYFDGYLASLRVYDSALNETQVKQLAADAPDADVLIHIDSGRLDYGPVVSWTNEGSLGGKFLPINQPPMVENADERIAVHFEADQSLQWTAETSHRTEQLDAAVGEY